MEYYSGSINRALVRCCHKSIHKNKDFINERRKSALYFDLQFLLYRQRKTYRVITAELDIKKRNFFLQNV